MMKMFVRWLCFSPRTNRIEDSSLSEFEQELSDLEKELADQGYVVEEMDTMPVDYGIAEHNFGVTANRESYLWGFVAKIAALLKDDAVNRVALWGLEGSWKSGIARTLNDELYEDALALQFDLVIWVAKEVDLRRRLRQIAHRLGLTYSWSEEPDAVISRRIYRKLQSFKTRLIIIDLDILGIPWRNDGNGVRVKILITTRDQAVCRRLAVDHVVKLDFLSCDDAWKYFCTLIGETATIEPMAKQLCMQLGGYQFAIKVMGKIICQWKYGLKDVKFPDRLGNIARRMIYASLKSIELRLFTRQKMKSCFLLCASYPGGCVINVEEVVCRMVAQGIVGGCRQEGLMLVQGLKDVCLLEDGLVDETVTMHAVIHGFARWLLRSTNEGNMYGCLGPHNTASLS